MKITRISPSEVERITARFLAKVERRGPRECWPWTAAKNDFGHGLLLFRGRPWGAHRIAYLLEHSAIPAGLMVLHSRECITPACVNPAHLYVGTQKDNMADRDALGRHGLHLHPERAARGVRNGACTISDADVASIRALAAEGLSQRAIAARFGTGQAHVSRLVNRKQRSS